MNTRAEEIINYERRLQTMNNESLAKLAEIKSEIEISDTNDKLAAVMAKLTAILGGSLEVRNELDTTWNMINAKYIALNS